MGSTANPKSAYVGVQDAGYTPYDTREMYPVYHTHGLRQYIGTCKYHLDLYCPHLVHWVPGRGLGKTVMREWEYIGTKPNQRVLCKTCWGVT